jgi:hypothetical protein
MVASGSGSGVSQSGNSVTKSIGLLATVLTVIIGLITISQYMSREIKFLAGELKSRDIQISELRNVVQLANNKLVAFGERFKEVETKLNSMKLLSNVELSFIKKRIDVNENNFRESSKLINSVKVECLKNELNRIRSKNP